MFASSQRDEVSGKQDGRASRSGGTKLHVRLTLILSVDTNQSVHYHALQD